MENNFLIKTWLCVYLLELRVQCHVELRYSPWAFWPLIGILTSSEYVINQLNSVEIINSGENYSTVLTNYINRNRTIELKK